MSDLDTVGDNYYKPAQWINTLGSALFWLISILSIATLFVDRMAHPLTHHIIQISLIVLAMSFFTQGLTQKLYFIPRAEDKRRLELLSNSYGVALTHEETSGYYNNDQKNPLKRLAASVMESAYFTHKITGKMLVWQRTQTAGYIMIYLIAILNRSTNLELLAVAAQAIFSEEIIARWVRMEWLRSRSERVFDNLNLLFTSKQAFSRPETQSQVIDLLSLYETTKSTAATILSSNLFHKHNANLTAEWEQIRKRLGI